MAEDFKYVDAICNALKVGCNLLQGRLIYYLCRRVLEAWDRGATEVCMQGGINPDYTGKTYLSILDAVKGA